MADTFADLTSDLQNYVVAPMNAFGLGGFVFDIQGEGVAHLSAEITDHYTESNKALQDHIAIRPKRITLKGYVGELTYKPNDSGLLNVIQQVTQKLTTIAAFLPQISAAATQAQSAISGIKSGGLSLDSLKGAIPDAANIYGLVQNVLGQFGNTAKQQAAYQYFSACQSSGILMGIQTPWEFLTGMAVETIVAIQTEDSIFITDFSVTFKQIRIAKTTTTAAKLSGTGTVAGLPAPTAQGAALLQGEPRVSIGAVQGSPSVVSLDSPLNNPLANIYKYHS